MLRVLSIESDVLGHKNYCDALRSYFSGFTDIALTPYWYREHRSLASKIVNKLAHVHVPLLNHHRDFWRTRVEWSQGDTSKRLAVRELSKAPYDLLHFHTQVQAFRSTQIMKAVPTVVSVDMTERQASRESTVRYPATYKPTIAMEQKVFEAAAHLVTWSEWAKRSVVEDYGISAEKVSVISPGARLDKMYEPLFEVHEKPRILFAGHDFRRKGGWDLLEVFNENFSSMAELHLMTGADVPGHFSNVHVHKGATAYSESWQKLFRNSDIFVMPSYAEALGLVFQEAAGYGLALIGSDVGGIPETVSDGENGFLITPGDRLALVQRLKVLLKDEATLLCMRRKSREIALKRFDALRNFRAMADLFQNVAADRDNSQRLSCAPLPSSAH